MKNYIKKIIQSNTRYSNALGIIIIFQFMLVLGLYKFIFEKPIYAKVVGRVENIKMGTYLIENTSTFEIDKQYKQGLEIKIEQINYYVDGNEEGKWDYILQKIKPGDYVTIFYHHFGDRNLNSIYQLELNNEKLTSIDERNKPMKYIILTMIILLVFSLLFLIYLIFAKYDAKKYK